MVSTCHLKCVGPYGVHVSPKLSGPICIHLRNPLQNQWQNDEKSMNIYVGGCLLSHVGSRWHLLEAILAQDDREDRFFIDFWCNVGLPKWYKNQWKNEVIFRHPKKPCFLHRRCQRLQNGAPKDIQNEAFFWTCQNYRIVLPPARGASFRGLKGSQTTFCPGPFLWALFMLHWNPCFSDFS